MLYRRSHRVGAILGAISVLLGMARGSLAQTEPAKPADFSPEIRQAVLTRMGELIEKNAYVPGADFSKWPQFLEKQKAAIEKAENARDFVTAVNGALRNFGISHIVLNTPQAATARRERKAIGIGVNLQPEADGMRVINLFPGAPAEKAGLELGDLIFEADGKKPENTASLAGDEGTTLKVKVKKSDGKVKAYAITRAKFSSVRPETLTWPDKETAILKINTFDVSYSRQNVEDFVKQAAAAKRLIVDLRSNGGGAVNNFVHLLGLLMKEGTPVGTFVSRQMVERFVKETGGKPNDTLKIARWSDRKVLAGKSAVPPFKGHIAVLVNGGTGSASEIVAAALQEVLEAPVVGSKSAGAVLVSVMVPLPNGYQLQYPISDYVTMRGVRLEGNGVQPDADAPIPRFREKDLAVEKAVALLHRAELRDDRFGQVTGK